VVTNHGPDYDRQKWGCFAKFILKTGENLGTRFANHVIAISEPIKKSLADNYNRRDVHLIFNGVNMPIKHNKTDYLKSMGIEPGNYLLAAGRFVPEKGFIDLIKAWDKLPHNDRPQLVIAGDADHETCYSKGIRKHAEKYGAILTGFVKGGKLNQLFTHARMFVMPSYHEGLPIALLEALSYGLDVVVSDIPANTAIGLEGGSYFETGNKVALTEAIQSKLKKTTRPDYHYLLKKYDWDIIARQTEAVYNECLRKSPKAEPKTRLEPKPAYVRKQANQ
jgi:glycosyltransferase involved in cell wall biosynthesis